MQTQIHRSTKIWKLKTKNRRLFKQYLRRLSYGRSERCLSVRTGRCEARGPSRRLSWNTLVFRPSQ
jgi:hypothetical protein